MLLSTNCKWTRAHVADVRWHMCVYDPLVDKFVSRSIVQSGSWEREMVENMLAEMRRHPGAVLLDIGSNIGYYALAAAAAHFRVLAFEPVPQSAMRIEASLRRNNFFTVTLYPMAVSNQTQTLHMDRSKNNQGGVGHSPAEVPGSTARVMLPAPRIDDVLHAEQAPLYLKMDIEGGECAAFSGMQAYLLGARRIIGVNMEFGQSRLKCCNQLVARDGPFDIFRRHGLCPRGTSFEYVCASASWDLVWAPCTTDPNVNITRR